jgi:hypothetical protein
MARVKKAELYDGTVLRFPGTTPDEDIDRAVKDYMRKMDLRAAMEDLAQELRLHREAMARNTQALVAAITAPKMIVKDFQDRPIGITSK